MPRPLYPPDAAKRGKDPSAAGGDVEAIKRAVSRSGHWPWGKFDQAYSNNFAHGKSGNVSENGLAGLQRQNHIDATGWMGEKTYNLIRSALIPAGLPHAGQHILDDVAIALLGSYTADAAGGSTVRELALEKARSFLGYQESPPGTNGTMFGAWYGLDFEPWCAMFVSYCFAHVAPTQDVFVRGITYAYVPFIVDDAINGRNRLRVTSSPIPGDLVCYDWQRDGLPDHVGIFEDGDAADWNAIEGNTSPANDSNGGQVMRRHRWSSDAATTFVRVT